MSVFPLSKVCQLCKALHFYALSLLFIFLSLSSIAQFRSASQQQLFNSYKNVQSSKFGNPYRVIAFQTTDDKEIQYGKLVRPLGKGVAIVCLYSTPDTLLTDKRIIAVAPASDDWKLSASLQASFNLTKHNARTAFTVVAFNLDTLLATIRQKKIAFEVLSAFRETQTATIRCHAADFYKEILPDTGLLFADVSVVPQPDIMVPGYRRSLNTLQLARFFFPEANGKGITIGIKENRPQENDIDLHKRILSSPIAAAAADNHATTIATLAGGAGNSDYSGLGTASACRFFPSTFSNLFPDSSQLLRQYNVSVQNHSYGTVIQSFYGAEAMSYDVQTAKNPTLLPIFSSGNQGTAASTTGTYSGIAGFANLTGNFKVAKNVLTVAAVDTGGRLAPFSSSGPLFDGRLAPQITALGPNGTSEAAALISGAAAVLQQVYRDSSAGILPSASLIKAVLYTTCDDIGNAGIDYQSGYGLLNLYNAIHCLQQRRYDSGSLVQRQVFTKVISLPANATNLKLTLCWTDTAALVNTNATLTNDLDLTLTEVATGTVYHPWVLSSVANADSLRKLSVRRQDSLNTAEQISINLPAAGNWQVQVNGRKVSTQLPQAFSIAYSWDTLNRFRFTNPVPPLENETLRQGTLPIRWTTVLSDTNATGSLFISYNNGLTWQNIGNGISLKNKLYYWPLPDTTTSAQLRMDCAFGQFFSSGFLLGPATTLQVDYLCRDSMRLSWNAHRLANAYTLFALGDTAYMKQVFSATDTFIVLKRSLSPASIYAIQPVVNGAPQATRSIAFDVQNQGSNCFYNTFYAQPATDSILLTIEASFTTGLDSIVFEKVTASGLRLSQIATVYAAPGVTNYTVWDTTPLTGANYYRATVRRGGSSVLTNIISLVHTGRAQVFLYPNPVRQGQPLTVLLKENTGTNRLQLLDMTGRLLKTFPVAGGGITTGLVNNLPAGLYVYRLLRQNNQLGATGKLLVQ